MRAGIVVGSVMVLAASCAAEDAASPGGPTIDAGIVDGSPMSDAGGEVHADADAAMTPATLDDFWNGAAYFALTNRFVVGSDGNLAFSSYNASEHVVVKDGVWYLFARTFVAPVPAACAAAGVGDSARTVVRSSTDKGKTWSNDVVVVDQVPGAPTECAALDGNVHYDAATSTWHLLYQCIDRNAKWNICHSTHVGASPLARFVDDPANPVVRNGDLWKKILGATTTLHDEGTPEILGKIGGAYYVTFHGIDSSPPIHVFRGIAKTSDFVTYAPVNTAPIFSSADCNKWDVAWAAPGCYGGGASATQQLGSHWYMMIESSDTSGGCAQDQAWVLGMLRSPDPTSSAWEPMKNPAVGFSTQELQDNGKKPACAVGYPSFFVDEAGVQHLLVFRGAAKGTPNIDFDPGHGHFLYELRASAPALHWSFREGPGYTFTGSDTISRGNQQARLTNVTFTPEAADGTFSVGFDGVSSVVQQVFASSALELSSYARVEVRGAIRALPSTKSALFAGKLGSYWFELYANGDLCFWVTGKASAPVAACVPVSGTLGARHLYAGEFDGAMVRVLRDGVEMKAVAAPAMLAPSAARFQLGAAGPDANGFYGSFAGVIDDVQVFDRPRR